MLPVLATCATLTARAVLNRRKQQLPPRNQIRAPTSCGTHAHPLRCALPRLGGVRRAASGSGRGIMPGVCQARPTTAVYAILTVTVASKRRKQQLPLRLSTCVRTSCGMTVRPMRCAMRHLEGVRRAGRRSGRGRMQDVWRARTAVQSASQAHNVQMLLQREGRRAKRCERSQIKPFLITARVTMHTPPRQTNRPHMSTRTLQKNTFLYRSRTHRTPPTTTTVTKASKASTRRWGRHCRRPLRTGCPRLHR